MTNRSVAVESLVVACAFLAIGWGVVAQEPTPAPLSTKLTTTTRTLQLDAETTLKFVWIVPGSFLMGSRNGYEDEKPVHRVTISQGFELAAYEVTQGQWRAVMASNPARSRDCGPNCPVDNVSWYDAQEFVAKLNALEGGYQYRLPTEAEWEYAARAGTTGDYGGTGSLNEMAWNSDNSGMRTHPVGQKPPNRWGLYDMHGNVWEMVSDWYGSYSAGSATDPTGPAAGAERVIRGGAWGRSAEACRSASRVGVPLGERSDSKGFRLLRVQYPKK